MIYENKDRYLLVKQTLVMLEMARLNAVISINGVSTDVSKLEGTIINALADIERNFTLPREMIEDSPIYLDLSYEAVLVNGMNEPVKVGDDRRRHIPNTPDEMHDVIFKYPSFENYVAKYNENLKNQSFFDKSRKFAGDLITASSSSIQTIRKWAEGRGDQEMKLGQILLLVNMVETIEWLFDFTNATSRRQILNVDNDPTNGC